MIPTQSRRLLLAATALAAIVALALSPAAHAQEGEPPVDPVLSPYWKSVVSRWEEVIVHYAEERSLDPDFVASVIWKESHGNPRARSVVGAVGLMQLMPWPTRPSPEKLEDPWINLSWGARALAQTIRDGQGDLYYSLAAYNGGWAQIHLNVTRRYATAVLTEYSRAVAVRHGLPADGTWTAVFAIDGTAGTKTITVLGPQRTLARYTRRPWLAADIPSVPPGVAPHATAITFVDERGQEGRVDVWLLAEDGTPIQSSLPTPYPPEEPVSPVETPAGEEVSPLPLPTAGP